MDNKRFYDPYVYTKLFSLISNVLQLTSLLEDKRGDYNTYDVEYTFYDRQRDILEGMQAKLLTMQTEMLATNEPDTD